MFECPEVGMGEVVDSGLDPWSFIDFAESFIVDNMDSVGGMYARKFVENVLFASVVF